MNTSSNHQRQGERKLVSAADVTPIIKPVIGNSPPFAALCCFCVFACSIAAQEVELGRAATTEVRQRQQEAARKVSGRKQHNSAAAAARSDILNTSLHDMSSAATVGARCY